VKRLLLSLGSAAFLAVWLLPVRAAEEQPQGAVRLSPATFKHFRQVIRTDYEFRWRCLPWEINPGEAAQKAAREGKPILTFGGHDGVPLGFE
jgi:hypothetical protein